MRVWCEITVGETEGDYGGRVPETVAECGRCGHRTQAYGDSGASARRTMVAMREECLRSEKNYYVGEGAAHADAVRPWMERREAIEELAMRDVEQARAARELDEEYRVWADDNDDPW